MRSFGYLLKEGFQGLWKNRTMSIASMAVLLCCLLLTGLSVLFSLNINSTMKSIEGNNNITVYLDDNTPQITAIQIGEEIRSMDNISSCTFVAKDEALANIMEQLGDDGTVLNGLSGSDNWLPDAYNISIKDLSRYDETMTAIENIEGVNKYTDYSDIAKKLNNLDILIRYACIAIVAVLAIVSLFIISNTIKVTMFSRRVEINIMKSVGATNGFVRVPFVVEGLIIGIASGLLASAILYFSYDQITMSIYNVVSFLTAFDIKPYKWYIFGMYIIIGAIFGILGGSISIGKYLKKEGEDVIA
jgi:cell division transport system permease protein